MNEFDYLFEDSGAAEVAASPQPAGTERPQTPVSAPEQTTERDLDSGVGFSSSPPYPTSRSVIKTAGDAEKALRGLGQKRKLKVERGDGKCQAYAPKGTKCKLCGKVHPL